jgi:hypothetical protein
MATALLESPDVEREVVSDRLARPLSVPSTPQEAYRPGRDITFLSVLRFVVGAITSSIGLAIQFLVEATAILLIPFAPFLLLVMAFPLMLLVALIIVAGGAVLTALGLV